jgi:predicted RNA-binding Zn ribbon-like protein
METLPVQHRPLLIVGGNVALDLANTVDAPGLPTEFDHLQHPTTALAWAEQAGLLDHRQRDELARYAELAPDRAATELRRLHRLRRAVEDVFGAVADRTDIPEAAWVALRRAAGDAVAGARLDRRGDHGHPTWELDSLDALGRPLAYAAWDLLTSGPLHRVKRCPACPWIYLDQSKNGSRRWCTMEDCGKSAKMQRYVAKRAAARRAPPPAPKYQS